MLQTAISGHRFKVSGSLTPDAEAVFRKGLTSLLDSQARIVEIDLREVDLITSTCIGALVTLWMDLRKSKRKMKLEVSARVKKILDMTGLTTILSMDALSG